MGTIELAVLVFIDRSIPPLWCVHPGLERHRVRVTKGIRKPYRSSYLSKLARRLRRSRYFPKVHNSLSRQLNRLAPDLEEQGIKVAYFTEGRKCTRVICLEKVVKISSAPSAPSADDLNAERKQSSHRDDLADDRTRRYRLR
jgi:hypothetical protein